jgi:N-acetylglutamate synthase-like GNAT family acetyltransferase
LTQLAIRSKAVWGYDDEFMERAKRELTVTPELIERHIVTVAEREGDVVGFCELEVDGRVAWLRALFVCPNHIRTHVGRLLFEHAADLAACLRYKAVKIESDPYAEGFYLRMGAVRTGEVPSGSIPGRMLPMLEYRISFPVSEREG